MARVYATQNDYRAWAEKPDAVVSGAVLARASLAIDNALIGARYAHDAAEMPTEPKIIEAMRDATCAQVQWYDETGDTTGSGAADRFQSASIGSAGYTRGYTGAGSAAGSGTGLAPTAAEILKVAGFTVGLYVHG